MNVALVTGASGAIGGAVVRALTARGCTVAAGYRTNAAAARRLADETGAWPLCFDACDPGGVRQAVDNVLEKYCQLDILVCAAGTAWTGLTQEMDDAAYRRVMADDLDSAFFCCRAVLPHMVARKRGRIVTVSSMWGQVGASCEVAYSAAKAGVIGLTKALAKEVGPSGITVNCVAPGVVDTPMNARLSPGDLDALADDTPLGRIGTPEETAAAVAWLCSPEAGFITGQVLGVNGGLVI